MKIWELDISTQIVYHISDQQKPMTPSELAGLIGTTRQSVYNNIKKLIKDGVIYKENGAYTLHPVFMSEFDNVLEYFKDMIFEISKHIDAEKIDDNANALQKNVEYMLKMMNILERM